MCFVGQEASRINSWITNAIRRTVQYLQLCLKFPTEPEIDYMLPSRMFRSETLTELCLVMRCHVRLPSSFCLPKLKSLTLLEVTSEDGGLIEKLLSVPSLENLTLHECIWWHLKALNISAPKLLCLCITEKEFPTDIRSNCPVLINAPDLLYFHYSSGLFSEYAISGASMLLQALVEVHGPAEGISEEFAPHGNELLKNLSARKHLILTYNLLEEFNMRKDLLDSFPVFSSPSL